MRFDKLTGILLGLAIVLITAATLHFFVGREGVEKLQEASGSYVEGEKAKTLAERENAFNRALTFYSELASEYQPDFGTGKLFFNLGNTYFQLNQYPMAIYNFEKAFSLLPREEKVKWNLRIAKEKLGIAEETKQSNFDRIFLFHHKLSLPERLQVFFILSLIVLFLSSCYLWFRHHSLRTSLMISLIFWTAILCSLGYTRYLTPLEGIIVKATELYRDAGHQYATVTDNPVLAGSKVEVLDVMPNGKWLKITAEGQMGYVPQEAIRLI